MYHIHLYEYPGCNSYKQNLDIESFVGITTVSATELREELISRNVGLLDLKYLDTSNNNQSVLEEWNIQVWKFQETHFHWLIQEEKGKIKFIEISLRK